MLNDMELSQAPLTSSAQRKDSHTTTEPIDSECQSSSHVHNPKYIKLCSILDANKQDPLACSLRVVDLCLRPNYQCISYVWGDPDERAPIQLDGRSILAPSSLIGLLSRLRGSTAASSLWVDTLCIDQENHEEKKEQVGLMGEIYANAERVIVWLGDVVSPGPQECQEGPGILDAMMKLAQDAHFHDLPFSNSCRSRRCPAASGGVVASRWTWSQVLEQWMRWFDVSWFERAWTVQEIVLARKALLLLGPYAISWDIVSRAWVNLGRHMRYCCSECIYSLPGQDSTHIYRMADRIIDLSTSRDKLEQGQHLIDSLLQFSWKKSSREIDKIYGFLGLQTGARPTPVTPDYDISLQELYYRFARDLIFTQDWLVPLCLDPTHEKEGLPSWVPDWSLRPNGPALYRTARFQWSFAYRAAEGFRGFPQVHGRTLEADGSHFDSIVRTSSAYARIKRFSERLYLLEDWQNMMSLEGLASRSYPGGGTYHDAFWKTMFADRYHGEVEPRVVIAADIQDLQDFVKQTRNDLMEFGADTIVGLNEAMTSHIIAVAERRLFITSKGYIGLCPEACEVGDEVFVLGSCPPPVVLRSVRTEDAAGARHKFMGHCFVHGIMYGEATDMGLKRTRLRIE